MYETSSLIEVTYLNTYSSSKRNYPVITTLNLIINQMNLQPMRGNSNAQARSAQAVEVCSIIVGVLNEKIMPERCNAFLLLWAEEVKEEPWLAGWLMYHGKFPFVSIS